MIISKKKYEAAIKEAVDKALGEYWREKEYTDQRRSINNDFNRMYDEIRMIRNEIARAAAELSKRLGGPTDNGPCTVDARY